MAGLRGCGSTEPALLLFGIDAADAGEIRLKGQIARIESPRDAIQLGLAFCSEDRKTEGILPNLSVRENLIIALQAKRGAWRSSACERATCTAGLLKIGSVAPWGSPRYCTAPLGALTTRPVALALARSASATCAMSIVPARKAASSSPAEGNIRKSIVSAYPTPPRG